MAISTTPRLMIRAFNHKDAAALYDCLSSPLPPCFQDEKLHSLAEAREEVDKRARDAGQFAVCLKETDTLIGYLFADNGEEPDTNTWCVGWHFNPRYQGQGFASESVAALFAYLFTHKGARRLYAYVEDDNLSSQKLCTRMHMRQEGCFKEFVSFVTADGEEKYVNTFIYALLKKEWRVKCKAP